MSHLAAAFNTVCYPWPCWHYNIFPAISFFQPNFFVDFGCLFIFNYLVPAGRFVVSYLDSNSLGGDGRMQPTDGNQGRDHLASFLSGILFPHATLGYDGTA